MTYKLAFNESALKEWKKLGHTIQEQFKKKLRERLENPRVPASQLHGRKDQYKIKLRGAGYRLVYSVEDEIITVTVIGVGKRENDAGNGKHLDIYKTSWSPHTHQDAHHDWLNSKLRPHDFPRRLGTDSLR